MVCPVCGSGPSPSAASCGSARPPRPASWSRPSSRPRCPNEHRMIRIVVADDHHVVRTGFAALLGTQADFTVAGTAVDGAEAVRLARELSPDVIVMDVRMPGMDGIEATRQLAGSGPRVLILTTFDLD